MDALTLQLLEWVDERPRSYGETLEIWRSTCPRLTIWEDAVADRLLRVEAGAVLLTPAGVDAVRSRTRLPHDGRATDRA